MITSTITGPRRKSCKQKKPRGPRLRVHRIVIRRCLPLVYVFAKVCSVVLRLRTLVHCPLPSNVNQADSVRACRRAECLKCQFGLPQERFSNANSPVLVRCYESHFRTSPFVNSKSTVCYFGMAPNAKGIATIAISARTEASPIHTLPNRHQPIANTMKVNAMIASQSQTGTGSVF